MRFIIIFLIATVLLLLACQGQKKVAISSTITVKMDSVMVFRTPRNQKIREFYFDGCEYLEFENYLGMTPEFQVIHRGNCKNPIHYYMKVDK